ncbi:hypothetical protein J1N09_04630 [Aureitalea sp. L0-47]|uniref:FKBP-type peptidyl-prolyl cis-trans isomerase n=1 Tax=Aureitalea sp. L0-47 TaxID=2816962 RepID=UPI002236F40D|nr:hypothetical protein [Aureitalea sp. L0-47]MCW5519112.1 hypothetical protein [Aureitalea sp. L0-47]
MKKYIGLLFTALSILLIVNSCGNDDDVQDNFIPARDRAEEAPVAQAIIEEYLNTHFYNYEEFANPPANFDFQIKFDTIAGVNSDKTPLREQVTSKMVKDRIKEGLEYKLYYLVVEEGGGDRPEFPDLATITYDGTYINKEEEILPYSRRFDASTIPIRFDMTAVVNGLQDVLVEFKGATSIVTNPDGSTSFEGYGIGAVFMPSGLGYYVNPPPTSVIPTYAQLIFAFQLYENEMGDQDNDGVPSVVEDLNGNNLEEDDDTDLDLLPNYADNDDDGDGRPTRDEIEIDANGNITYPDEDGDGIVDYLDSDS